MQDPFTLCEGDNKPCRSLRHSFHRKLDSYLVELKNKTESFGPFNMRSICWVTRKPVSDPTV